MPMFTAVLSRSPEDRKEARQFEDALSGALAEAGANVLIVPHLYYLTASHPAAGRMAQSTGEILVASWLCPRAAYWTLRANGIQEQGSLTCHDLNTFSCVEECIGELCTAAGGLGEAPAGSSAPGCIEEIVGPVTKRWYPVLDYSRCASCKQCLDFCLFGVYSLEHGQVVASCPDHCKPGCPACARVCPEGAIIFPHYGADPAIAGAPGARVPGRPVDVDEFFGRAGSEARAPREPCPVCGCACECERWTGGALPAGKTVCPACGCICERTETCECSQQPARSAPCDADEAPCSSNREASASCDCGGRDDLDDLIDALDAQND